MNADPRPDPGFSPHMSPPITSAFEMLKQAIKLDPAYAWCWHCNLAMPILDTRRVIGEPMVTHRQANEMAANLMQHLFAVDVRASREWAAMFSTREQHENGDGR